MTKDQKAAYESDTERQLWLRNEASQRRKDLPCCFSLLGNAGRSQKDAQCAIWDAQGTITQNSWAKGMHQLRMSTTLG